MSVLRGLRRLGEALTVLTLLLLAAAVGLWWWTGTQHALDWAWARYAQPLGLQGEQVSGSLREGLRAQRLRWSQDGLAVEARAADIGWNPVALVLQRRLHLTHLRAAELAVQDRRPAAAPQAPASLALPVDVAVDDLMVGRLRWLGDADAGTEAGTGLGRVEVADLSAHYRYARGEHHLGLRNAALARGRYQGDVRLGDAAPMPVRATLTGVVEATVPGRPQPLKLAVQAQARGPLADLALQGRLEPAEPVPQGQAPRADLSARLTAWQRPQVPQARARLEQVDLSVLWPQAPQTLLRGTLDWAPEATGAGLAVDLANGRPGPWDQGRLPVSRLQGRGEWRDGTALARSFIADLGGGRAEGRGEWLADGGWRLRARMQGVQPGALHTALGTAPVSGRVDLDGRGGAIGFVADLQASSPARAASPSRQALALEQLKARGRWDGRRLALPEFSARVAGATLEGALDAEPASRSGLGRLALSAPGLRGRAEGELAPTRGNGEAVLEVTRLSQARAWLQQLPRLSGALGLPAPANPATALPGTEGDGRLALDWRGGWRAPTVQARLNARATQGQGADTRRLAVDLAGQASATGPLTAGTAWQARLDTLRLTLREPALAAGDWSLQLQQPLALRIAGARVETGPGQAVLTAPVRDGPSQARLAWDPIRWGQGELQTAGRLTGLPMAWLALVGHVPPTGDLAFDGQWEARLGAGLRLRASLARASGDITLLAETAEGTPARVTAGVREARLAVDSDGDAVNLGLRWDSERAGTLDGRLSTRLARGGSAGWRWPDDAPLSGRLQARLPRMAVWSLLAPPGWRLRGSLEADLTVAGTRADPRLLGALRADDLGLRSVVDGVALQDGRLRARLDSSRLLIDELVLQGAGAAGRTASTAGTGGSLRATGEVAWVPAGSGPSAGPSAGPRGLRATLTATLDRLRASVRPDREVTVSGTATATLGPQETALTGDLRVDRARIALPDQAVPQLGPDVTVRNLPPGVSLRPGAERSAASRPLRIDARVTLGDDVRVLGRGATARLRGAVDITGDSLTQPRLAGSIEVAEGEYLAFGQRLDIERGVLRFTGPADNPALDILAVRTNPAQRVGVQVTGRAQSPMVRLYAQPDLPEAEKLSWLVLGRSSASGGAEAALLQEAALSLLTRNAGGGGPGIAGRLGLDELSVRREGTQGAAITLGKRFASNFYAAYERSLSGALGTLRVFYDLTERLTVRAEAGDRAGVDLIYTLSFD